MRSFFQKKKHKEDETNIIFILESGLVSSAIVKNESNLPPHFLFSSENSLIFQQEVDPDKLTDIALAGLKSSAEKISKEGLPVSVRKMSSKNPNICIFFGSPWYVSTLNNTTINKEKPFLIKEKMIEEAAEKAFSSDPSTYVIEHNILGVKSNGYDIENPIGRHANVLEIKSFANSVSKKVIEKVEEIMHSSFPNSKIRFFTIAQALFPVAKELIEKKDFILFVPEYETSEVILIRNNTIEASVSIPFGKHTPLRAITEKLEKGRENAESILHLFLSNELEEGMKNKVAEIIKIAEEDFQESIQNALWKLSSTIFFPRDVVISDADNISKLLGEWVVNDTWLIGAHGPINVVFLDKNLAEVMIKKESVVGVLNPSMISAGFYVKSI